MFSTAVNVLQGKRVFCIMACMSLAVPSAWGHSDIFFYVSPENQLTTHERGPGLPSARVFTTSFEYFGHIFGDPNLPKFFQADDPGFDTDPSRVPDGHLAVPGDSILWLDFVALNMPSVGRGNFFYWDGADPDNVSFEVAPPEHVLTIRDGTGSEDFGLNGSDEVVGPAVVGITSSAGSLHDHILFRLDPRVETVSEDPVEGMYLFAIDLWMSNLDLSMSDVTRSETVLVALASPEITPLAETRASQWLEANLDSLTAALLIGDFNGNGSYELDDIDALVASVAAATHPDTFDLTGDGLVDLEDVSEWLNVAGAVLNDSGNPLLYGDANLDGAVDGGDFIEWNGNKFTSVAAWSAGDFNADGVVDGQDFLVWNGNKFQAADLVAVPEPSSLILLISLFGLATVIRSRRDGMGGRA